MQETYNLELLFKNAEGGSKTITLRQPQENLPPVTVQDAMNVIANTEIFDGDKGDPYAVVNGARYVRRTVEDIYSAE